MLIRDDRLLQCMSLFLALLRPWTMFELSRRCVGQRTFVCRQINEYTPLNSRVLRAINVEFIVYPLRAAGGRGIERV